MLTKKNTITLWQNTKTVMAIYGYIFKSNSYSTLSEDKDLMKSYHCDVIIEEDGIQEKLRPEWRKMLCNLEKGDTIIITKLSHALRGIRELGVFLDLCSNYKIRLISIHDYIDTNCEYYPDTTVADVLETISKLSSEVTSMRRSEGRFLKLRKGTRPKTLKAGLKLDREKTVVNMYNSGHSIDDIWKVSGYKSRTSVFRVLNRHGVQLNRGRHQGPIKKRNDNN